MRTVWKQSSFYISSFLAENLDNYIQGVMNKSTSAVFLIDGRSGLGKTTLSFQIGCYINSKLDKYMKEPPDFKLSNITWTPEDFIERLKIATKGEVIILDESMILSNRITMSEVNKMVIIMMSMIRSKQIFVIFNINSIFDMDKNLPLHRADMLIHLYAEDDKFASRGRYIVVPTAKGKLKNLYIHGKKFYDYSCAKPAFYDRFDAFFPFDENEYEHKKQEAITNYFNQGKVTLSSKVRESRDNAIKHFRLNYNTTIEELATAFKISERTVYEILK